VTVHSLGGSQNTEPSGVVSDRKISVWLLPSHDCWYLMWAYQRAWNTVVFTMPAWCMVSDRMQFWCRSVLCIGCSRLCNILLSNMNRYIIFCVTLLTVLCHVVPVILLSVLVLPT